MSGPTTPPVIVIPMGGMSRRFTEAGYGMPKYMLPLHGRSVFAHALDSFRAAFATAPFVFAARDVAGTEAFVRAECESLGIHDVRFHRLTGPTAGQAETVALALEGVCVDAGDAITIFNIDTFRPGFAYPEGAWRAGSAGYLEVFRGSGANWSYVRPALGPEPRALETAEKRPISDLCCTGLYHFARADQFHAALAQERRRPSAGELYVAPIYNHLIAAGLPIHYDLIARKDVVFCGVPLEYEALVAAM